MGAESQLIQIMKEKATAVQTIFNEVSSMQEAFAYFVDLTKKQGGSCIAAPDLDAEERLQLAALCEESAISLVAEGLRDHIGKMHTAITRAQWGIAETATLVLESTSEDLRVATMLSETHVAVLPRSRIQMEAMELTEELSRMMQAGSYVAFISGASRTADIERVLTIGVHGPQEFHILALDG